MVGRTWRAIAGWLDRRPAVLPLLALGAVLIAVAAGPKPSDGAWTGLPDGAIIRWTFIGLVLLLCALGLVILLMTRTMSARGGTKRRSWVATVLVLALLGMISLFDFEGELPPEEPEAPPVVALEPTGPPIEPGPGFEAGDATALAIILLLAVIVLIWTRRAVTASSTVDPDNDASPLGAALATATDHLLDGDDPREAVLLAYHALERTLESLELPRRESETPTEHLDRALRSLAITDPQQAEPLLDLAGLYARARYSEQRITVAEQRRAGESLGRARQRLVGAD